MISFNNPITECHDHKSARVYFIKHDGFLIFPIFDGLIRTRIHENLSKFQFYECLEAVRVGV